MDHAGKQDLREDTPAIDWSASFFSVYDGRTCQGHVLVGRGTFQAFDADDKPLGSFSSKDDARRAVSAAARGGQP
jgi:hypothetical protein